MATLESLPEEQVKDYLSSKGLLGDISGAPVKVQLFEFREPKSSSDRVICVKNRGSIGSSDDMVRRIGIVILVVSAVGDQIKECRLRAEDILKSTLTTTGYNSIISMQSVGGVLGPYRTASDRVTFEIPLTVIFSNGE